MRLEMTKFFNKWTRKIHRWLAEPTAILIPIAVILRFTGDSGTRFPPQIEQFQSIMMLLLAVTGTYLFLIPYIVKMQRERRKKDQEARK
jgi:hypothetical protein